jgi:hypothetical protein
VIQTIIVEAGNGKDPKGKLIPSKSGYHNFCEYRKNGFVAVGWLPNFDLTGKSTNEINSVIDTHLELDPGVSSSLSEDDRKKAEKSNRISAKRVLNRIMNVRPGDIVIVPGATHRIYGVGIALSGYQYLPGKMDPNGLGTNFRNHYINVAWVEWSNNHKVDFAPNSGHYLERAAFKALGVETLWPGLGFTLAICDKTPEYLLKAPFWSRLETMSNQIRANQPVTLPSIEDEIEEEVDVVPEVVVEEKVYTGDKYSKSEDGHYVGNDGFIVPKDFNEFYAMHPMYVRRWVTKKLFKSSVDDDVLDFEADLLMHLHSLPQRSKARTPGYNGLEDGCKDVIQSFNPKLQYGASAPRFFNYIRHCLSNRFNTLYSKNKKNPICSKGNYAIGSMNEDESGVVDDEYIHSHSSSLGATNSKQTSLTETKVYLQQFFAFVEEQDPQLITVLTALSNTNTYSEAIAELGMDDRTFHRCRSRLKLLSQCFNNNEDVPKQRKEYKKRTLVEV